MKYEFLDSGNGKKLERFGQFILERPCSQAVWKPQTKRWKPQASFSRDGKMGWRGSLPKQWETSVAGLKLRMIPTDFGHLGVFPEHIEAWRWLESVVKPGARVLNLFAYSGVASLIAAKAGANVCHVDAAHGMVSWARENAELNGLEEAPIRWIVDDVGKFLAREIRRESFYDIIVLDPPTFGRGKQGEIFKIETDLPELLAQCRRLLSDKPQGLFLSCHTPGYTPTVLTHLVSQACDGLKGKIEGGEMLLEGSEKTFSVPCGAFARWTNG